MARASANGIELEYDTFGDPENPALLLVMGLSMQLIAWEPPFCEALAARGFHVIRFDNRDIGLSTKLDGAGVPDIQAVLTGDLSRVPYRLDELAADTAGLLDALGIRAAHVAGVSMGGMVAQLLAIAHPSRVLSLTSIMSTTGDRAVGRANLRALATLLTPAPTEREAFLDYSVTVRRVIGSPGFPLDEARARRLAAAAYDRSFHPQGVARQLAAIVAAPDRTQALGSVACPTLVIHGAEDPLIDVSGGEATARAVPGAELAVVPGMGHELPVEVWPQVIDGIARNAARATAAG